jgi:glycerol-3-phosphate cytidylyltransferase-like family protein
MIVTADTLADVQGKTVMVAGGFDPLHPGHVGYFRAASALGLPIVCSVDPDEWIARKHPVLLLQHDRVALIDAIRFVDYTYAAPATTAEALELVRPRVFAKGSDWRGRLPRDEIDVCERHGIEIVFLDTVTDSSTDILRRHRARM